MLRRHRLVTALALVGVLGLAACGGGSSGDADDDAGSVLPTADSSPDAGSPDPATSDSAAATPEASEAPSSDPSPDVAPTGTEPIAPADGSGQPDDAATEPAETSSPAETAPPDAVAPAEIGGRLLGAELRPEADFPGNPLPDITVHDVGRDQPVNLRNALPADRPVLLWAWAPH